VSGATTVTDGRGAAGPVSEVEGGKVMDDWDYWTSRMMRVLSFSGAVTVDGSPEGAGGRR
jgi:hypothetical protein